MPAGDHADIVELVADTVEATTPYAVSGTPAPTAFRRSEGPSMDAAQSRQFDVVIDEYERRNDTGVNAATAFVERSMRFRVVLVERQGHESVTEFGKTVFEDVRRIQDKVVRAVREAGGGTTACWCDGAARPDVGSDAQSVFVSIPFAAQWNESEYTSGA